MQAMPRKHLLKLRPALEIKPDDGSKSGLTRVSAGRFKAIRGSARLRQSSYRSGQLVTGVVLEGSRAIRELLADKLTIKPG